MADDQHDIQTQPTTDAQQAVLDGLMAGASLRATCQRIGIDPARVYEWMRDDEGYMQRYARAREVQAHRIADGIFEVADDDSGDSGPDAHARVARHRLMVDTRKWYLSKVLPKIYGDKLQLTGDGGGPIQIVSASLPASDAVAAYLAQVRGESDVIDTTATPVIEGRSEPMQISAPAEKTPENASIEGDFGKAEGKMDGE